MSDEIGKVIRRDLDRLPLLPEDRWLPPARPTPSRGAAMARRGLWLAAVAIVALAAGLTLARVRADLTPGSAASAPPAVVGAGGSVPVPSSISREQAIAIAIAPGRDVGRVDRVEAKLMTFEEYVRIAGPWQVHPGDPQASPLGGIVTTAGDPAKRYVWVVAVSGEVWPSGRVPVRFGGAPAVPSRTPYPPYRWGMFLVDAGRGRLDGIGDAGLSESWPAAFDRLPDHPAAPSVAVVPSPLASPLKVGIGEGLATAAVMMLTAEVRRIDRIEVKLMTRGEYEQAQPSGTIGVDLSAPLWVIALAGEITPQFARGASFASAAYLVDANTGSVIGVTAGAERWPAFFDALPNHGTQ
jgi:hypothetical protein